MPAHPSRVTRSLLPVPEATEQWQDANARGIVDGTAALAQRTAEDAGAVADIAGTEIYRSEPIPR